MHSGNESGFVVLIPVIGSVLLGAVLAVVGALGLVASLSATPDPVEKPLVTYNSR